MSGIRGGLPDYLALGLSILFVGINPGLRSSEVGHHFAGPSNRFWKLLFEAGLVPQMMTPSEDARLLDYGFGLTNLVAKPTVGTSDLTKQDFEKGRRALLTKIRQYQPALVAVLGISVGRVLWTFEHPQNPRKRVSAGAIQVGLQPKLLEKVPVFVLPNPSGRNAHYSFQKMKELFGELRSLSFHLSSEATAQ